MKSIQKPVEPGPVEPISGAAAPRPEEGNVAAVPSPKIPASAVALVAIVVTAVAALTVAGVPAAGISAAAVISAEAVRRLIQAVRS